MHPEKIWSICEEAQRNKCSLSTVVQLRSGEAQAGANVESVEYWTRKILGLYFENTRLAFMGLPHLQLVTDAATHASKETLLSIVYSHEVDICGLTPLQHVSRSKVASPGEFNLLPEIEDLAALRKLERLHAYRFLCALSHQISELTCGRLSLPSYLAPMSMCLSPLNEHTKRIAMGGQTLIKDTTTGEATFVNLDGSQEVPILAVSIDQGGIGAASKLQFSFRHNVLDGLLTCVICVLLFLV
eukprot:Skav205126  [mRNA]  locus=scaffold4215:135:863:+ [translate_table: standard]